MDALERQTVDFSCEVNQVDVDGRWYREDCRIRPGDNIRIRHQGEAVACTPAAGAAAQLLTELLLFLLAGAPLQVEHTRSLSNQSGQNTPVRSGSRPSASRPTLLSQSQVSRQRFQTHAFVGGQTSPAASALGCLFSELPVQIVRPLRVKIAMYRHRGLLECQVSRPSAQVKWYKNRKELLPGPKYQVISQDVYRQLHIEDVRSSDEDTYTCDAGDDETSCQLLVEGELAQTNGLVSQGCSHVTGPR